jgi:hypothetical protein
MQCFANRGTGQHGWLPEVYVYNVINSHIFTHTCWFYSHRFYVVFVAVAAVRTKSQYKYNQSSEYVVKFVQLGLVAGPKESKVH